MLKITAEDQEPSLIPQIRYKREHSEISDEEAFYIRQITEEKMADETILATVTAHRAAGIFLEEIYRDRINGEIQNAGSALK